MRALRPSVVRFPNLRAIVSSRSDAPLPSCPVSLLAKGIVQRAEALGTVRLFPVSPVLTAEMA